MSLPSEYHQAIRALSAASTIAADRALADLNRAPQLAARDNEVLVAATAALANLLSSIVAELVGLRVTIEACQSPGVSDSFAPGGPAAVTGRGAGATPSGGPSTSQAHMVWDGAPTPHVAVGAPTTVPDLTPGHGDQTQCAGGEDPAVSGPSKDHPGTRPGEGGGPLDDTVPLPFPNGRVEAPGPSGNGNTSQAQRPARRRVVTAAIAMGAVLLFPILIGVWAIAGLIESIGDQP